ITHLAALAGAPTVAIFGPYDPIYWAPLGRYVAVIDAGLRCPHRTDPRDGCRTCDMLAGLGVEVVWQAAVEMRKMIS
ncbi:MAG TPA: glycosyltransferase family 9 protein, partial [Chloroflexota bacterium]|nr:glycosyltransferase family 9 protein [Chloroflexota bacterium]